MATQRDIGHGFLEIESPNSDQDTIPLPQSKDSHRATSARNPARSPAHRPMNQPAVRRAAVAKHPSSYREASRATPANVRTMVGAATEGTSASSWQWPAKSAGKFARRTRNVQAGVQLPSTPQLRSIDRFVQAISNAAFRQWPRNTPLSKHGQSLNNPCQRSVHERRLPANKEWTQAFHVHGKFLTLFSPCSFPRSNSLFVNLAWPARASGARSLRFATPPHAPRRYRFIQRSAPPPVARGPGRLRAHSRPPRRPSAPTAFLVSTIGNPSLDRQHRETAGPLIGRVPQSPEQTGVPLIVNALNALA